MGLLVRVVATKDRKLVAENRAVGNMEMTVRIGNFLSNTILPGDWMQRRDETRKVLKKRLKRMHPLACLVRSKEVNVRNYQEL